MDRLIKLFSAIIFAVTWGSANAQTSETTQQTTINWQQFTSEELIQDNIPPVSLRAPFIGIHNDALIVAGGAVPNLGADGTENYLDRIWVAKKSNVTNGSSGPSLSWEGSLGLLPRNIAFGASVSSELGVIVIGGADGNNASSRVYLLRWDEENNLVDVLEFPEMPSSLMNGAATIMDNILYVMVDGDGTEPAGKLLTFDLSRLILDGADEPLVENNIVSIADMIDAHGNDVDVWQQLSSPPLAANEDIARSGISLTSQYNGRKNLLYAIARHRSDGGSNDIWAFDPNDNSWARKSDFIIQPNNLEVSSTAALPISQSHILLTATLAGAKDDVVLSYNAITDAWSQYGDDQLAVEAMRPAVIGNTSFSHLMLWQDQIVRVKSSNQAFSISTLDITRSIKGFGWQNNTVVVFYLTLIVFIGIYFASKNKNTNDYFRGGQHIPWWAAGCSIYATMLSSLTYVAIPALIYRTDWILMGGTLMILVVSPIAIYMALPFFRQIDATSAYEYLSKRFNMPVRLFASALFTFFHFGRIGIVLALTALALSAVTPLLAWQAILIMGGLSIVYCTLGGVEAVIWTDTLQTIVLFIGAIICLIVIIGGINGGFEGFVSAGMAENKFRMVDWNFSADSIKTWSIWVIVLGGIGQGISSYTADQATVQRYMTTKDTKAAAKSIWTNAFLSIPSGILFLSIGTGLYVFYKSQPEKLDPTIQIDQVFPFFIATELPLGVAGLIIAGIFAAAQSTVSTSINSIATTLVTDFMRPFNVCHEEKGYLNIARFSSFLVGLLGTLVGLLFISPEIRSLAEEYYKVIGMFMGALGGLFMLGMTTRRTTGWGALIGIFFGVAVMMSAWIMEWADGFLFATIGILVSMLTGYLASIILPSENNDLDGLTLYTMKKGE